ncbi:MAG TPA: hypothetical protein VF129_12605 [Actinomycetota bacterium]
MSEIPQQTHAGAEDAVGRSSPVTVLTQGWVTGVTRGALAFVVMAALGQAMAFAVNLAQDPQASAGTAAKLGWLYFGWFHRVAVTARLTPPVDELVRGLTVDVGLAMLLATFLAIAILYRGGRAVADRAGGGAVARALHGMKVAPAYAIPPLVVSALVDVDIPIPRNALVAGTLQMESSVLPWFVLPLLIAVATGAAGGLRSGRFELLSREPWGRRATGAIAGGLRMFVLGLVLSFVGLLVLAVVRPSAARTYFEVVSRPPTDQTAVIIANHTLLLPNQSMWVLVPAMGGCDGLSGGVSASFLCYSKFPESVSVSTEGLVAGTTVVEADVETAPPGYFLFLLVPAASVVLGGRYAARKRARLRSEAIAVGAVSGVVFAILVAVGSWLASVSVGLSTPAWGIPGNTSVLIGPGVWAAGLLALAWGVIGGGLGGWLGGREFPPMAQLARSSGIPTRRTGDPAAP